MLGPCLLYRKPHVCCSIAGCASSSSAASHRTHRALAVQMVKLWGPRGDMLAYRRSSAGGAAPLRLGGVSHVAWHPNRPIFACGGADPIVKIYEVGACRHIQQVLQQAAPPVPKCTA